MFPKRIMIFKPKMLPPSGTDRKKKCRKGRNHLMQERIVEPPQLDIVHPI
jgi:hypothetical protein